MSQPAAKSRAAAIYLPDAPAIVATARGVTWLSPEGEVRDVSHALAAASLQTAIPILCHAPLTAARLSLHALPAYDVLELFAFVWPGRFCVPTPGGLARVLGFAVPQDAEAQCVALIDIARALLTDLTDPERQEKSDALSIAREMTGWGWRPFVLQALGAPPDLEADDTSRRALKVWERLPEWAEIAPEPPPGQRPVTPDEAEIRLQAMLGSGAETRAPQVEYTRRISKIFEPAESAEHPHLLLAEAGTGVGKTLGYLAPATVWAEKNGGAVWVSTFTKNLQQQVEGELARYYATPETLEQKVTVRKGRENYLCLLNLEDAVQSPVRRNAPAEAVATGLMARWVAATKDGDFTGNDFPGWLVTLLGRKHTLALADRRGECIYAACTHFHRCFAEKSARKAPRAHIVVANHAFVMVQAAQGSSSIQMPQRYIFDEGHHLFDAADSAFAAHLTGQEMAELRRWLLGAEETSRSRARGLKRRVEDLCEGDETSAAALDAIIDAARGALASPGWAQHLAKGEPRGAAEAFLSRVRTQVLARTKPEDRFYNLECETQPLIDGLSEDAVALAAKLRALRTPMQNLARNLRQRLEDQADTLSSDTRKRIESVSAGLERRAQNEVGAWVDMLQSLKQPAPEGFVDWFGIDRIDGKDGDLGMYRHWVDPTVPLTASLRPHAHGIAVTSATLKDTPEHPQTALIRSGFRHLPGPAESFDIASPFDYPERTRVLVITDVNRNDGGQVAAAYRVLFQASGGGALGLFTAIARLRHIHKAIAAPLEKAGIALYAQHVDGLDTGTLIDIFREEENACLLGTDATRDGVDVPGRSLRLIVFDRVPWPRPTFLHKARKELFGKGYDDMLTRLRLKQAYGRLIRRQTDKGVFIMLDSQLPTRLCDAFPPGVNVERVGLAEAVTIVKEFL